MYCDVLQIQEAIERARGIRNPGPAHVSNPVRVQSPAQLAAPVRVQAPAQLAVEIPSERKEDIFCDNEVDHDDPLDENELDDIGDMSIDSDQLDPEADQLSSGMFLAMALRMWSLVFRLPRRALELQFKIIGAVMPVLAEQYKLTSPYRCDQLLGLGNDDLDYNSLGVCGKCTKLYYESQLFSRRRGQRCNGVLFGKRCGHQVCPPGTSTPRYYYHCTSITDRLREILTRSDVAPFVDHWKTRTTRAGCFTDVYDGAVWREFQTDTESGQAFLSADGIGLMLNVDWFRPFKHSPYSQGAIYLSIMNLPRAMRFLPCNIILLGTLPPLTEKEININGILRCMVDELKELWGLRSPLGRRVALLCVASDMKAARTICGFKGPGARKGCSRCHCWFDLFERDPERPHIPPKVNMANFVTGNLRTRNDQVQQRDEYLAGRTKTARKEAFRRHGFKGSILLELSYFNASRMMVVDPMHNLWMGTAKHMCKAWVKLDILTDVKLKELSVRAQRMDIPSDIRRIASKIRSGFSSVLAEEWKDFTNIYSMALLKGILPAEHLEIWEQFVLGSRCLSARVITEDDLRDATGHFVEFGGMVRGHDMYGDKFCTTNMHMHIHLASYVRDYGPIYAFWCFAFERYNGMLGSFNNNGKAQDVGLTMARTFSRLSKLGRMIRESRAADACTPQEAAIFMELTGTTVEPDIDSDGIAFGAGALCDYKEYTVLGLNADTVGQITGAEPFPGHLVADVGHKTGVIKGKAIRAIDAEVLGALMRESYPDRNPSLTAWYTEKSRRLQIGGEVFGSVGYRYGERSSLVSVVFDGFTYPHGRVVHISMSCPAQVMFYCVVRVFFEDEDADIADDDNYEDVTLARVRWFVPIPAPGGSEHVRVWEDRCRTDTHVRLFSFVPVHRIECRIGRVWISNDPKSKLFRVCKLKRKIAT